MLGQLLFLCVAMLVVVGVHYYLWRRLVRDTTTAGSARRIGTFVVVGLVALVLVTFVGTQVLPPGVSAVLAWPGYLWLAMMFYLLLGLALLELPAFIARHLLRSRQRVMVSVAPSIRQSEPQPSSSPSQPPAGPQSEPSQLTSRRLFLSRAVAVTAGVAAVGLVGVGVPTALGMPQLKRIQIPLAKLPRGADRFRIALVSDIHLGPLNGLHRTRRIVEMINGLDADIVTIVGDLVDGTVADLGSAAAPLGSLRSRRGAYFVTGNHEYYSGYEEWIDEVTRLDIRPLRNERLELPVGIDLAGVNDVTGKAFGDGPDFDRTLRGRDLSRPVILLAHQPVQAHDAAAHGVDLQLSGHTHGGQLAPFNLIVRATGQPVVSGLGEVDGMPVYVTNGSGFWGPPVRVGARPDVTLVELHAP